jgi:hypothetical protein
VAGIGLIRVSVPCSIYFLKSNRLHKTHVLKEFLMPLSHLPIVPAQTATRWSSPENWAAVPGAGGQSRNGRKGSPCFTIQPGETKVIAEEKKACGMVRRIWMTLWNLRQEEEDKWHIALRGVRLRCYWDGSEMPAVDVPIGDFFCQGLGRMERFENALFSSPEGRSLVAYVPMPFRTGMRMELYNDGVIHTGAIFYDVDYTVGDLHAPEICYFHAHWRREARTTLGRDFELLPTVEGRGRFLGACVSVIPDTSRYGRMWWGEGEMKAYIDGDGAYPTLCGTGTEDYIGTAWGQGRYAQQWQGCPVVDEKRFRYSFYRIHGPDPVYFQKRIRVAMQQIGLYHAGDLPLLKAKQVPFRDLDGRPIDLECMPDPALSGTLDREGDDWACCSWLYLDSPANELPALAAYPERIQGLGL